MGCLDVLVIAISQSMIADIVTKRSGDGLMKRWLGILLVSLCIGVSYVHRVYASFGGGNDGDSSAGDSAADDGSSRNGDSDSTTSYVADTVDSFECDSSEDCGGEDVPSPQEQKD